MLRSLRENTSETGPMAVPGSEASRSASMPSNITSPPKATVNGFGSVEDSDVSTASAVAPWFSAGSCTPGPPHEVSNSAAMASNV